jgi:hypothetical protein
MFRRRFILPQTIDPDNPWARRLLREGPGGRTRVAPREPWFRSLETLTWISCVLLFPIAPLILQLVRAPIVGLRWRRRLMDDPILPELLQVSGDAAEPAAALRAGVSRWSRRVAIVAAVACVAGWAYLVYLWNLPEPDWGNPAPRTAWHPATPWLLAAWCFLACASWTAGCHMRASVVACWPRYWWAKGVALAWAGLAKLALLYGGCFVALVFAALAYGGRYPVQMARLSAGGIAGCAVAEAFFFFLRLRLADRAWRGAEKSLAKELEEIAASPQAARSEW